MKANDLVNKPPKILIYGPAGCGKTGLVSQASKGFMFDFDDGMNTARTLKDNFSSLRQSIEFETYRDTDPSKPVLWMKAKEKLLKFSELCANNKMPYNAVIVDSLTGMAQSIQNQIMANAGKPLGKPEIQHYGMIVSEVENALTVLSSLKNILVILTAHEMPVLSKKGSTGHPEEDRYQYVPLCVGTKLADRLPWMFDEVWYADVDTIGGKTQFSVSGKSSAFNRSRTRSGFNKPFVHNTGGLVELLKTIHYDYK